LQMCLMMYMYLSPKVVLDNLCSLVHTKAVVYGQSDPT
jgi:hypothetical protein